MVESADNYKRQALKVSNILMSSDGDLEVDAIQLDLAATIDAFCQRSILQNANARGHSG